ncbi:hypothetical protein AAU01_10970 [Paenarthrobacter aurescens]|uniref:Uncharacterized protein n=1 Tax=Paenarthrobacter aurescens TaxID=43663 RepID=A0A4Y3N9L4_PAEAU|nr:hypothetical protein AAU01_10970 [Paenarthrobacter aurescens]
MFHFSDEALQDPCSQLQLMKSYHSTDPNFVAEVAKRPRGIEDIEVGLRFTGSKHGRGSHETLAHAAGLAADHCQMAVFGRGPQQRLHRLAMRPVH